MIFWIRSLPNNKQAPFPMPMSPAVFVYGALDVPSGPALAPPTAPGRLSRLGLLPQSKVSV